MGRVRPRGAIDGPHPSHVKNRSTRSEEDDENDVGQV